MTQDTKKDKNITTTPKEDTKKEEEEQPKKQYREKPQLPSVAYLLQHGAEKDPNAPPETFLQSLVLPGLLLLTFVVSLAFFHWLTNGFSGPRLQSSGSFQQKFGKSSSEL